MKTVHQLCCKAWPDMEAPKDTKVLLDLHDEAEKILNENPDITMMVHCSAGVGRTGTFIGLFKLVKDFENDSVRILLLLFKPCFRDPGPVMCVRRLMNWIPSRQL